MSRRRLADRVHPAPGLAPGWRPQRTDHAWAFWRDVVREPAASIYRELRLSLDRHHLASLRALAEAASPRRKRGRGAVREETVKAALERLEEHRLISVQWGERLTNYQGSHQPIQAIWVRELPSVPDVVEQAHLLVAHDRPEDSVAQADVRKFLAWWREAYPDYKPHPADWRLARGLLATYGLGGLKKIAWHLLRCGTEAVPRDQVSIRKLAHAITQIAAEHARCPRCNPAPPPPRAPIDDRLAARYAEGERRERAARERLLGTAADHRSRDKNDG